MKLDITIIALLAIIGYLVYTISTQTSQIKELKQDMGDVVRMVINRNNTTPEKAPEPEPEIQLRPYESGPSQMAPPPSAAQKVQQLNPDPVRAGPTPGFPSQDLTHLFS
jgi:hypothetical protein